MSPDKAVELVRQAFLLTLVLSAPVMGVAMLVGLVISMLQAVTQIQDQTLSFVPKIIVMVLITLFTLPWGLTQLMQYSTQLFMGINQ